MKKNKSSRPHSSTDALATACGLCGLSADQVATKIRHAERILARAKDRKRAARAIAVIRHGCQMFQEIGGGQ